MTKARGFKKLKGETITKVDESCVNMIALWDSKDNGYLIEVDMSQGVPVLTLRKVKPKVGAKLNPPKPYTAKDLKTPTQWPFPLAEDKSLD